MLIQYKVALLCQLQKKMQVCVGVYACVRVFIYFKNLANEISSFIGDCSFIFYVGFKSASIL